MGTSNFLYNRAPLYAITNDCKNLACDGVCDDCEWSVCNDSYAQDDLRDSIAAATNRAAKAIMPAIVFMSWGGADDYPSYGDNRNFPARKIAELRLSVPLTHPLLPEEDYPPCVDFRAFILLRHGYYDGLNLDVSDIEVAMPDCEWDTHQPICSLDQEDIVTDWFLEAERYDNLDIRDSIAASLNCYLYGWVSDGSIPDDVRPKHEYLKAKVEQYRPLADEHKVNINDEAELYEWLADCITEDVYLDLRSDAMTTADTFDKVIDDIYNSVGKEFFDGYRLIARASNGEAFFERLDN